MNCLLQVRCNKEERSVSVAGLSGGGCHVPSSVTWSFLCAKAAAYRSVRMWRAQQVNRVIVKCCARVVGCFAGFGQVWNVLCIHRTIVECSFSSFDVKGKLCLFACRAAFKRFCRPGE